MNKLLKLRTFRYGDLPKRGDGLRIGTTRRPPRGVTKDRWGDYFDVWFPVLAPSAALLQNTRRSRTINFRAFCASYERELLGCAESRQSLDLLAALALRTPISIGCYCEDESRCHRSHLRKLIERAARELIEPTKTASRHIAKPNTIVEFSDKIQRDAHGQFQAWRRSNPHGFFLNQSRKAIYLLHCVNCVHSGSDTWKPEQFGGATLTKKPKICSTKTNDLEAWAANLGYTVRKCSDCIREFSSPPCPAA